MISRQAENAQQQRWFDAVASYCGPLDVGRHIPAGPWSSGGNKDAAMAPGSVGRPLQHRNLTRELLVAFGRIAIGVPSGTKRRLTPCSV